MATSGPPKRRGRSGSGTRSRRRQRPHYTERRGRVAQWTEQRTSNPRVAGSNPARRIPHPEPNPAPVWRAADSLPSFRTAGGRQEAARDCPSPSRDCPVERVDRRPHGLRPGLQVGQSWLRREDAFLEDSRRPPRSMAIDLRTADSVVEAYTDLPVRCERRPRLGHVRVGCSQRLVQDDQPRGCVGVA
jgi:hypothetical protein